jgi:integrase/recombinase XerD
MNLSDAVKKYIEWKRRDGCRFERGGACLVSFARSLGDMKLSDVTTDHVLAFLNGRYKEANMWRSKYWNLCRFFEHWAQRGIIDDFVMPEPRLGVRRTFLPYIFTKSDLRLLLDATSHHKKSIIKIDEVTFQTILLFLYATGASIGELPRLRLEDLDLANGFLLIRDFRAHRHRLIPIGPDLGTVLQRYLDHRSESGVSNPWLFVNKRGQQIGREAIHKNFGRLRRIAGVYRCDGSRYQPRIADLRFTFAVHSITKWIDTDGDLNRMLPALAAYMGQVGLGSTERYLLLTPARFHRNLDKLSPRQGIGGWSRDAGLMRFLDSL